MQIHQLKPKHRNRRPRRIGRGGKRGTYSGRGIKGQKARAGAKFRPAERELLKKIPKLRGYKFKSFRIQPNIVNLSEVEKKFKEGDTITPAALVSLGLTRKIKGKTPKIKILGSGEVKKKLKFKNVIFSEAAKKKLGIAEEK